MISIAAYESQSLAMKSHISTSDKISPEDESSYRFSQKTKLEFDDDATAQAETFDFRNMPSNKLQSSMSAITQVAHLSIEDQIALGVGFMKNNLTKVDASAPDTSDQPQDILAGLKSFIDGDRSRGDLKGAASLTNLMFKLDEAQSK